MKNLLPPVVVAAGMLAFSTCAPGAVIYSGPQNIAIPTTFDGIFLDIDTGATSVSAITSWDLNFFFGGVGIANSDLLQPARSDTDAMDAILNLPIGTLVDNTLDYATGFGGSGDPNSHTGGGAGQFVFGQPGYMGFQFTTNSSSGPYFGWVRVTLTPNTSGAVIHDWAYDNSGMPLYTPEPSRALLLMAGSLACMLRRRRGVAGVGAV